MWQTEFGSDCSFIVSESSTTAASTFLLRFLRMNTTRASLERDSLSASRRYVISSGPVNLQTAMRCVYQHFTPPGGSTASGLNMTQNVNVVAFLFIASLQPKKEKEEEEKKKKEEEELI